MPHAREIHLIVMGDRKVGKTTMCRHLACANRPEGFRPVMNDDGTWSARISVTTPDGGKILDLKIQDTFANVDFAWLSRQIIPHETAFIVMYAVDDPASFSRVLHYLRIINNFRRVAESSRRQSRPTLHRPNLLFGNKTDSLYADPRDFLDEPEIAMDPMVTHEHGSAKTGERVKTVMNDFFGCLLRDLPPFSPPLNPRSRVSDLHISRQESPPDTPIEPLSPFLVTPEQQRLSRRLRPTTSEALKEFKMPSSHRATRSDDSEACHGEPDVTPKEGSGGAPDSSDSSSSDGHGSGGSQGGQSGAFQFDSGDIDARRRRTPFPRTPPSFRRHDDSPPSSTVTPVGLLPPIEAVPPQQTAVKAGASDSASAVHAEEDRQRTARRRFNEEWLLRYKKSFESIGKKMVAGASLPQKLGSSSTTQDGTRRSRPMASSARESYDLSTLKTAFAPMPGTPSASRAAPDVQVTQATPGAEPVLSSERQAGPQGPSADHLAVPQAEAQAGFEYRSDQRAEQETREEDTGAEGDDEHEDGSEGSRATAERAAPQPREQTPYRGPAPPEQAPIDPYRPSTAMPVVRFSETAHRAPHNTNPSSGYRIAFPGPGVQCECSCCIIA